jgi:hypothetical protein
MTKNRSSSFNLTDFFFNDMKNIKKKNESTQIFTDIIYKLVNKNQKIRHFFRCVNEEEKKILFVYVDDFNPILNEPISKLAIDSLNVDNASGRSEISECFSIHHFSKIFSIKECIYEMDVKYMYEYKMVDYIIRIKDGDKLKNIGVSVTRAMLPPFVNKELTDEDEKNIKELLIKKLNGLIISRNCVSERHSFNQSILHIWSESQEITDILLSFIGSDEASSILPNLNIAGTLSIWITTSSFTPIFTNQFVFI